MAIDEPILTIEELKEGEYKDSEKFLQDMFGSIDGARHQFRRQHDMDRAIFNKMIDMGKIDNANVILDIGTGYGYMVQYLAEHLKSAKILSIDISYTNLKAVRGRFRAFGIDGVHLVAGDTLQIPFHDDEFEAVESWEGLGNIVGFHNLIDQSYRVLKKGNWFVTDLIGLELERADKDVRELIDAVGLGFFESCLRKLGLLPTNKEVLETMIKHGFHDVLDIKLDSAIIISGKK